jgi:hypothetical protein
MTYGRRLTRGEWSAILDLNSPAELLKIHHRFNRCFNVKSAFILDSPNTKSEMSAHPSTRLNRLLIVYFKSKDTLLNLLRAGYVFALSGCEQAGDIPDNL